MVFFSFTKPPRPAEIIYYPEAPSIEKFLQTCGIPEGENRQQPWIRIAIRSLHGLGPLGSTRSGCCWPRPVPRASISAQALLSSGGPYFFGDAGPRISFDFGNAVRRLCYPN
jgi:hypothetical protein